MGNITKPYGDFNNNVDVADANKVNAQINQLYTTVNGGLDFNNVPGLGDMTTVTTTSKNAAGAINELQALPVFSMARQALFNGNFDVFQRGTSFTNPNSGSYTSDRWKIGASSDGGAFPTNLIHSQQSLTPGDIQGSFSFYRINPDGAGTAFGVNASYDIRQPIERGARYISGSGKKITVSFWAKSSIAGKRIGVNGLQNYGTGGSPSSQEFLTGSIFTLSTTWTKYTLTMTTNTIVGKTFGTNNDDYIGIVLSCMWGTTIASQRFGSGTAESFVGAGNIDITQVQLNTGDQALPFQPRSFADELALCQRYFYKTFEYGIAPAQSTGVTNGAAFYRTSIGGVVTQGASIRFPVRMRIFPTVTYYNPGAVNNKWRNLSLNADSGTPVFQGIGETGVFIDNPQVTGDAVGHLMLIHASFDAEL